MVIALLVLQVAGLVVVYLLLRRAVARRMREPDMVSELRAEVAALVTELNAATERNVALLEDGVRHRSFVDAARRRVAERHSLGAASKQLDGHLRTAAALRAERSRRAGLQGAPR